MERLQRQGVRPTQVRRQHHLLYLDEVERRQRTEGSRTARIVERCYGRLEHGIRRSALSDLQSRKERQRPAPPRASVDGRCYRIGDR